MAPILPSPTRDNVIAGANGWFLRAIIVLSALINSAHIVFQVVLLIVTHSYVDAFDYCGLTGKLFTLVGLHRYDGLSVGNILRLCCLDFVVLLITCLVYAFAIRTYSSRPALTRERTLADARLSMEPSRRATEAGVSVESLSSAMAARQAIERQQVALSRRKLMKYKADRLTYYLTEGIFCLLLFIASVLEPSVSSSVYFLYFLFIGSWFALNRRFTLGYQYFRIFIAMFVALHLLAVFLYQLPILQPLLPPERIEARLFGLVNYFNQTCEQAREFDVMHYHFVRFLHPLALMLLYFNAVCLIRSVLISKRYLKVSTRCPLRVLRPCPCLSVCLSVPPLTSLPLSSVFSLTLSAVGLCLSVRAVHAQLCSVCLLAAPLLGRFPLCALLSGQLHQPHRRPS